MSALPSPEVIRVERLEDALPMWPPSSLGWAPAVESSPPSTGARRPMQAADFAGWTPAGLDTLARVLRNALRANGRAR